MNKTQYDILAKEYLKTNDTILKKYVTVETIFHALDPIVDKNILDLGCGNGYFCRLYKKLGAKRVVGLDISEKQIQLAKKEELQKPLGIQYCVKDITSKLEFESEFDIITAIFLLNYIENKEDITRLAENVSRSLRIGGTFVATIVNPDIKPPYLKKYGRTITANEDRLEDGKKFKVSFWDDNEKHAFDATCVNWSIESYQKSFSNFHLDMNWQHPRISSEGIRKLGSKFWSEFLANPYFLLLTCNKTEK